MPEKSEWEQTGLVLGGKEYSVGFLKSCGYIPPFDDARIAYEQMIENFKKKFKKESD